MGEKGGDQSQSVSVHEPHPFAQHHGNYLDFIVSLTSFLPGTVAQIRMNVVASFTGLIGKALMSENPSSLTT